MKTTMAVCLLGVTAAASSGCASMMEDRSVLEIYKDLEREPRFSQGWQRVTAQHEDNKGTWTGELSSVVEAAFKLDPGEGFRVLARRTEAALEERDLKRIYSFGYLRGQALKHATQRWMFDRMITTACGVVLMEICERAPARTGLCESTRKIAATCQKLNPDAKAELPPLHEPEDLRKIQKRGAGPDDTDNRIRLAAFELGLVYGFPKDFDIEVKDEVAQGFEIGCRQTLGALRGFGIELTEDEQRAHCTDAWQQHSHRMTEHCRKSPQCRSGGRCRPAGFFCA